MYHHPTSQNETEDFTRRRTGTIIPRAVLYVRKKTNELLKGEKKNDRPINITITKSAPPPLQLQLIPVINQRHQPFFSFFLSFLSFHLAKFLIVA